MTETGSCHPISIFFLLLKKKKKQLQLYWYYDISSQRLHFSTFLVSWSYWLNSDQWEHKCWVAFPKRSQTQVGGKVFCHFQELKCECLNFSSHLRLWSDFWVRRYTKGGKTERWKEPYDYVEPPRPVWPVYRSPPQKDGKNLTTTWNHPDLCGLSTDLLPKENLPSMFN